MKHDWKTIKKYEDILFEQSGGIAKITINRPEVYNAFRPQTNFEMLDAMNYCRSTPEIGVIILTGAGDKAFCSGGDQHYKGLGGYVDSDGTPRLNVLELHKAIRSIPKPVIAMVNGYAIGGGNVLNVVCDLSIASENARFGQTARKSAASTPDSAHPTSPGAWARRKHARFGISAASTPPRRPLTWVWSMPSCPSNAWRRRPLNGVTPSCNAPRWQSE